jgi:hypothetical protein
VATTRIDTTDPHAIAHYLQLLGLAVERPQQVYRLRVNVSGPSDDNGPWTVVLLLDDKDDTLLRRVLHE